MGFQTGGYSIYKEEIHIIGGGCWIFANIDFALMAIVRISPTTPTMKPQSNHRCGRLIHFNCHLRRNKCPLCPQLQSLPPCRLQSLCYKYHRIYPSYLPGAQPRWCEHKRSPVYAGLPSRTQRSDYPLTGGLYPNGKRCKHWGIETSFRELKYAVGLTNFHAKKVDYIAQEIWARMILYNFCESITTRIVQRQSKRKRKYIYQINYTRAIHICHYFFSARKKAPPNVENLIRKELLPVRPGRSDPRKVITRSAVSFLYRVAWHVLYTFFAQMIASAYFSCSFFSQQQKRDWRTFFSCAQSLSGILAVVII